MGGLQRNLSPASRSKLYLILAFASLIPFFYSVLQTTYVTSESSDLFGLASHFTVPYWIGWALILLCSIFAFLDRELKNDAVFIIILLILGLHLFGIAALIQENVRNPAVYCNLANTRTLLATGHVDIAGEDALSLYATWPVAQLTYASILTVTGIGLEELIGLAPFFWFIAFALLTYAIGRRFELPQNKCFLLSFLALSSYWWYQSDATQQGIGILLYLILFMLIVKPEPHNTVAEVILAILCFTTLILTHGLTSLALVTALVVLSIYRKFKGKAVPFVLLFSTFWLAWYMYRAYQAFELGIKHWWAAPWDYIIKMGVHVEGIYMQTYTDAPIMIQKYSSIAYLFLYGISIAVVIYLLIRSKIEQENRKWVLALLMWTIGLGLSGFMYLSPEMHIRLFIVGLVPVICIILKVFSARKLFVTLMLLCILLFLPARYGLEGYYGQVRSTELAGVQFFTYNSGPVEPWFFYREGDVGVLNFYEPEVVTWPHRGGLSASNPDQLEEASYVLSGWQGGERAIVDTWVQTGDAEDAALVYNSGNFKIYKNRLE